MSITIKEVAKLAGVSPSTVSRTCSNHPAISEKTKEKVRKAMAELGYEPNFQASNLVSKNSKTIGVILPVAENKLYQNSFFLEVIHGICQACIKENYMNTIISGNSEDELLNSVRSVIKSGKVDGFILLYSKNNDPILEHLNDTKQIYALIGKPSKEINSTIYIDNDNITAGKDATDYLIKLGHKKICFLYTKGNRIFVQDRKAGYISSLLDNNIEFKKEYCLEKNLTVDKDILDLQKLFSSDNSPSAIIALDDIIALSLEKILSGINKDVPNDISIITFNNSLLTTLTNPQLTCVDINNYQLGWEGAIQIIKHIQNPNLIPTKIIVPHRIIERSSCKKILF